MFEGFEDNTRPNHTPGQDGWYSSGSLRNQGADSPYSSWRVNYTHGQRPIIPQEKEGLVAVPPPPVPTAAVRADKSRPSRARKGLLAAVLALSLFGGAVGGSAATMLLMNRQADIPAIQAQTFPTFASPIIAQTPATNLSALDLTYAVERAAASVVEISINSTVRSFFGVERDSQGAGSGVVFSADGFIITNHHVIENASEIFVRTHDGREFAATLIGSDERTDLAVIKVEATDLIPADFADSDTVRVGQTSVAIGNPLGTLGGTVTHGIVSAMDRQITIEGHSMTLMQTSAAVNPGNSGGGLFSANGELIGIVNAKSTGMDIEGLGFAIPANIVARVTSDLIEYGFITGRPEIGIRVVQIGDVSAARYHGTGGLGVFVSGVTRDNGLEPGDQIIYIDDEPIEATAQIADAVANSSVGYVMQITVIRNGQTITIPVKIGEHIPEHIRDAMLEASEM